MQCTSDFFSCKKAIQTEGMGFFCLVGVNLFWIHYEPQSPSKKLFLALLIGFNRDQSWKLWKNIWVHLALTTMAVFRFSDTLPNIACSPSGSTPYHLQEAYVLRCSRMGSWGSMRLAVKVYLCSHLRPKKVILFCSTVLSQQRMNLFPWSATFLQQAFHTASSEQCMLVCHFRPCGYSRKAQNGKPAHDTSTSTTKSAYNCMHCTYSTSAKHIIGQCEQVQGICNCDITYISLLYIALTKAKMKY